MRAAIVAGLLISTPAVAADQFDLVCTYGKSTVRYRVDLVRNEACEGGCTKIWKMGQNTAGELYLRDSRLDAPTEVAQTIVINRQTGLLRHWIGGVSTSYEETATCVPASFSGFPASAF